MGPQGWAFFPSPALIFVLFLSLWGSFRGILAQHHQSSTREKETERKWEAGDGKKERHFEGFGGGGGGSGGGGVLEGGPGEGGPGEGGPGEGGLWGLGNPNIGQHKKLAHNIKTLILVDLVKKMVWPKFVWSTWFWPNLATDGLAKLV